MKVRELFISIQKYDEIKGSVEKATEAIINKMKKLKLEMEKLEREADEAEKMKIEEKSDEATTETGVLHMEAESEESTKKIREVEEEIDRMIIQCDQTRKELEDLMKSTDADFKNHMAMVVKMVAFMQDTLFGKSEHKHFFID